MVGRFLRILDEHADGQRGSSRRGVIGVIADGGCAWWVTSCDGYIGDRFARRDFVMWVIADGGCSWWVTWCDRDSGPTGPLFYEHADDLRSFMTRHYFW